MKKIIIGLILFFIPILALSAPSLGAKLQGKILLAVEDKGKTYYVHSDGSRYQITAATAQKIFEKLALGIKNTDLAQIPLKNVGITPEVAGVKITECPAAEKVVCSNTQCDYSSYTSQINSLNTTINQSNDTMQQAIDKITELKSQNTTCNTSLDKYNTLVQGYVDATNRAMKLADDWKQMYYKVANIPATPAPTPIQTPVIKCFYGTTVECFDLNTFPADLIAKLNAIAQKPVTMQSIVGDQLRAIHDYLGY